MQPASNPEFDATLSHCFGDAFPEFDFQYELAPGEYPPNPLSRVVMQFRDNVLDDTKASIKKTFTSDDTDQIEITDAATWSGTVKRQNDDLPVGEWYWGLWLEDSDGVGDTLGAGKIKITPKRVIIPS